MLHFQAHNIATAEPPKGSNDCTDLIVDDFHRTFSIDGPGGPNGVRLHYEMLQVARAYGWQQTPRSLVRDRDCVYGDLFVRRLRAMGIRDRPIAPRSPWQNGCAERLIGSIRRDCLDHVVVFGERHLRHLLNSYQSYYNEARTHLSLHKDAPIPRAVQTVGRTLAVRVLGGLHHQYFRA